MQSRSYRWVMALARPVICGWGRLDVIGLEVLGAAQCSSPRIVIGNHDTNWDPLVVGVAAGRQVQIRAMAKASLWRFRPMGWILDAMGQLKISRGRVDRPQLRAVLDALHRGSCVGVFPEGKLSGGQQIRAYSGAGWLARSVPDARVVAVAISGAVDLVCWPKRTRIRVEFFEPLGGQRHPGESSIGLSRRVLAEIRDRAPAVAAGRHR